VPAPLFCCQPDPAPESLPRTCGILLFMSQDPSNAQTKPKRWLTGPVFSWALYDLANTLFAMIVVVLHFPVHYESDLGGPDYMVGFANSLGIGMASVAILLLGALADHFPKKGRLIWFTLGCVGFTFLIGKARTPETAWIAFVAAKFCYHVGLLYYDALLPGISDETNRGRISGLGVALGNVGNPAAILLAGWLEMNWGTSWPFYITAGLYLLVALPCFFFVPESPLKPLAGTVSRALASSFKELLRLLVATRKESSLGHLVMSCFLFVSVIGATFAYASLYAMKVAEISKEELRIFMILAAVGAVGGSFVLGFLADKKGHKTSLRVAAWLWGLAILIALFLYHTVLFWLVGVLVGAATSGVWLAGRALVVALAPKDRVAQLLGFFEMVSGLATMAGPAVWSISLWFSHQYMPAMTEIQRYRLAAASLLPFFLGGIFFLRLVREKGS